jgi:hypothetical protein
MNAPAGDSGKTSANRAALSQLRDWLVISSTTRTPRIGSAVTRLRDDRAFP